jgi:pyridoxine kinase
MLAGSFVGTGDMFAALTVARFREQAGIAGLLGVNAWISGDEVPAVDLPLARTAERVLGSMAGVLKRTSEAREKALGGEKVGEGMEKVRYMKASELRLVQSWREIREPEVVHKAEAFNG